MLTVLVQDKPIEEKEPHVALEKWEAKRASRGAGRASCHMAAPVPQGQAPFALRRKARRCVHPGSGACSRDRIEHGPLGVLRGSPYIMSMDLPFRHGQHARRRSACDRGSPGAGYRQGACRSHSCAAPGPRCAGSWCRRLEDGVEGCGEVRFAVADQGLNVLEPLAEAEGEVAGFAVTPPRCIQRVPCPVNTRTCSLLRSRVSTCRKSTATIPAVWACRNCRQLGPDCRRAATITRRGMPPAQPSSPQYREIPEARELIQAVSSGKLRGSADKR